jgi:hypothetical protein
VKARPFQGREHPNFMPTHIIIFKEANEEYTKPEMFVCDAVEAGEIQALLESVGEECNGPIERLPYVEFVEKAETITLAELRGRFAEGPDAEGEEADYLDRVLAVLNSARPASE